MQIFVCDPEAAFYAELEHQNELDALRWQREEDEAEDEILTQEFMREADTAEWPWWLEQPYEIQAPEVFEP